MAGEAPLWTVRAEGGGYLSIFSGRDGSVRYRNYYARKEAFTRRFGCWLPLLLEDLIDLALTVYSADRLVRRHESGRGYNRRLWQRRFLIQLPVTNMERWSDSCVIDSLSESLAFLTEDSWEFDFRQRPRNKTSDVVQTLLFPPGAQAGVALFSGGLDSLAGLALQLTMGEPKTMVVLTCATNSRLLKKQKVLLRTIYDRSATRLLPIILPVRLSQHSRYYNLNERSQRSRGFLFTALGAVAAVIVGTKKLQVYENGIGSINLPLSEAQLGAQSSRATHPCALRKIELFLRLLLHSDFHIDLPYLFSTKGEMCTRLRSSSFSDLAIQSVSCDSFPSRITGPEHCGICTSCLLRRQALFSSGYGEDLRPGLYRYDIFGNLEEIPAAKLAPFWDMLTQVDRLGQAISAPASWRDLAIEFPELQEIREVVTDGLVPNSESRIKQQLIALYHNYYEEWRCLPSYPVGWNFSLPNLRLGA
jgi:hypothetical protein